MAERILFPEWRKENQTTKYPFAMEATLSNGVQFLVEGTLTDASLYPVGGGPRMYLSQVTVAHDVVMLTIGDDDNPSLASGTFALPQPEPNVRLVDAQGRPAGILVSDSTDLALFSSWGLGTFSFTVDQTEFCASCCCPMPQTGVRGVVLEDGSIFTGEVWLVGSDGVVLSLEKVTAPPMACGQGPRDLLAIRVDVVGDPLFQRRLCTPASLFQTPRFVKSITFTDGKQSVKVGPNTNGDVKLTVNNDLASDTVLRISPTDKGTEIAVVGSVFQNVD